MPQLQDRVLVCHGGYGPYALVQVVVGLERNPHDDPDTLRWRVEGAFPGEVRVHVLCRTEWERKAIELDTVLLDAFEKGRAIYERGEWANVVEHFQGLADRGLVIKTRLGWRRPATCRAIRTPSWWLACSMR